jgi:hypothetical protein
MKTALELSEQLVDVLSDYEEDIHQRADKILNKNYEYEEEDESVAEDDEIDINDEHLRKVK